MLPINAVLREMSEKSIIDALKSPRASELSRKRKVASNLPHSGTRHEPPKTASNLKSVSAYLRLQEFKGEEFKKLAVKLFCTVCKEEFGLRKTVIQQHISLSKHCCEKIKLKGKLAKEKDITKILIQYDEEMIPKGENVSMEQRGYRFKVVPTFLKAGFPINKVDQFRSLF